MRTAQQFLIVVAALIATSGCSTMQSIVKDDTGLLSDAITISTLAAIESSSDRVQTANEIIEAAQEAMSALESSGTTVATLVAQARFRIAHSNAELSQKAALHALINRLERELGKRVSDGVLNPTDRASVNELLEIVIAAARAYAG
jgi:hypothetical protein